MNAIIYKCATSLKWAIEIDGAWDCVYYYTEQQATNAAKRKYPNATINKWADRD